jgi:hypothetical protein
MNNENFQAKLQSWLEACQKLINDHFAKDLPNLSVPSLSLSPGKRYIRVVRTENAGQSRSVYAFIDVTNGDVLKPASWKAPAKHARGNIFDESNGLQYMSSYGPAYLR